MVLIEEISNELQINNIPFKETSNEWIIRCPHCLEDGKEKLKLYINKSTFLYHCFRCNTKGSILTINRIFNKLKLSNLNLKINKEIAENGQQFYHKEKLLIKIIEEITEELLDDSNKIKYLNDMKNIAKNTINSIKPKNKNVIIQRQIKQYLINRNINPYLLNILKIPHFYGYDINTPVYLRFGIPTFFMTNYEARIIINDNPIKYLKSPTNKTIYDFIFIFLNKLKYFNPYKNTKQNNLLIDKLYVIEGMFDALSLAVNNIPTVSMGGYLNTTNVLIFLLIIKLIYNININKIIFIYDNDLSYSQLEKIININKMYFKKIHNIQFTQLNYEKYKDISEIPPEKILDFIQKIK
jgi:hypothetical protein